MKRFKKIMAMALAFAMSLGMVAFGAEGDTHLTKIADKDTGSFTVTIDQPTNDKNTHQYSAYQIFKGDLAKEEVEDASGALNDTGVRKLTNIEWGDGVNQGKIGDFVTAIKAKFGSNATIQALKNDEVSAVKISEAIGTITVNDSQDAQDMAECIAILIGNATGTSSVASRDTDNIPITYEITELEVGYYFVQDTDTAANEDGGVTRYILQVVEDVHPTVKAEVPALVKKVQENQADNFTSSDDEKTAYGDKYNDVADYSVGDIINYELIGTLPSNLDRYDYYKYIFHDNLSKGLTIDTTSIKVFKVKTGTSLDFTTADGTNVVNITDSFASAIATGTGDTTDLTITCNAGTEPNTNDVRSIRGIAATDKIVVRYTAKLNKDAVIGTDGNPNTAYLEFSNNPNKDHEGETGKTPEDTVIVFTYEIDANKYADNLPDAGGTALAGAKFVLKNSEGKYLKYIAEPAATQNRVTWVDAPNLAELNINTDAYTAAFTTLQGEGEQVVFTSAAETGLIAEIKGLDEGTYTLVEIQAPNGYNLAADTPVQIIATTVNNQDYAGTATDALIGFSYNVNNAEAATEGNVAESKAQANIVDKSGTILPSTGGMGTTLFYIIGGALVAVAGILLVLKKRGTEE